MILVLNRFMKLPSARIFGFVALAFTYFGYAGPGGRPAHWTSSTFRDRIHGTLVDGGANTYIAADGTVQLINLWYLNHDGFIGVVFPNTHDNNEKPDLLIYWNKGGFQPARRTQLPTDG